MVGKPERRAADHFASCPAPPPPPFRAKIAEKEDREKDRERQQEWDREQAIEKERVARDRGGDRRRSNRSPSADAGGGSRGGGRERDRSQRDDREDRESDRRGDRGGWEGSDHRQGSRGDEHERGGSRSVRQRRRNDDDSSDDDDGSKAAAKLEAAKPVDINFAADITAEEMQMMQAMGIPFGFDTAKGKEPDDEAAKLSGYKVKSTRTARQYMNRRGGFNRPLPSEQTGIKVIRD